MRILFMNSIRMFGGGEIWMLRTLCALRARSHEVWLCCRPDVEVGKRAIAEGIPVVQMRFRGDFNVLNVVRLAQFMRNERIEVVLTNMDKELRIGGLAAWIAGIPTVLPRRGIDHPLKNRWQYRFSYNVLASRVIANSQATKEALLRNAPWLNPDRIEVIYNGVEPEEFAKPRVPSLRDAWGFPPDVPLLGYVGQLDERKGIATLLKAFGRVRDQVTNARLVLAGRGPLSDLVERETKRNGWEGAVRLVGFTDDIAGVMQAIDVLVLPSFWEGFGSVLIEAMAAGKPVVTTNVSSMPEIVTDGITGYLVPPGDPALLAARCTDLLHDPALRRRMGEAGRERARRDFTLERMVDHLEDLFRRAVAEGRSRR